jgi:putative flippase GtrA
MSSKTRRLKVLFHREVWRVARFLIVGAAVALTYAGLFLGLRAAETPIWEANGIAHVASICVQYVSHTLWTFRSRLRDRAQQLRFLGVIVFGFGFSFAVTTLLSPYMGWPDVVSVALVVFVLPLFNYVLYRFWVFRGTR